MNGDRWVPVRVLNTSDKAVTLKRHTKLEDVSTCVAIEDLDVTAEQKPASEVEVKSQAACDESSVNSDAPHQSSFHESLHNMGLGDLDVDSCEVSDYWKSQLLELIQKYEDVFSR